MAFTTVSVSIDSILQNAGVMAGSFRMKLSSPTFSDSLTGQCLVVPITWQTTDFSDGTASLELIPNCQIADGSYYKWEIYQTVSSGACGSRLLASGDCVVPNQDCDLINITDIKVTEGTLKSYASSAKQSAIDAAASAQEAEDAGTASVNAIESAGSAQIALIQAEGTAQGGYIVSAGTAQIDAISSAGAVQLVYISSAGNAELTAIDSAGAYQIDQIVSSGAAQITSIEQTGTTQGGYIVSEGNAQVLRVESAGSAQVQLVTAEGTAQKTIVDSAGSAGVAAVNAAVQSQIATIGSSGAYQIDLINSAGQAQGGYIQSAGAAQVQTITASGGYQVQLIGSAGAAQVSIVESAGAAQVENIQSAGAVYAEGIAANAAAISALQTKTDITNHEVDNIQALLSGNLYSEQTDSTEAYSKTVPSGALPWAEMGYVGGKTVVWNQFVDMSTFSSSTIYDVTRAVDTTAGTLTLNGLASASIAIFIVGTNPRPYAPGHKILLKGCPSGGSASTYSLYDDFQTGVPRDTGEGVIFTQTYSTGYLYAKYYVASGYNCENLVFKPQVFDLTLMFGAGNEPSTVAEFEAMFPAGYYPYNAGELMSAGVTDVVSEGSNLLNMKPFFYGSGFYNLSIGNQLPSNAPSLPVTDNGDGSFSFTVDGSWRGSIFIAKLPEAMMSQIYIFKALISGTGLRVSKYLLDKDYKILSVDNNTNTSQYWLSEFGGANSAYPTAKYFAIAIGSNTADSIITITNPLVCKIGYEQAYTPYRALSYLIPSAIQSLPGYGWSAGTAYNNIDYGRKVYVQNVGSRSYASGDDSDTSVITDGTTTYYSLATPVETDISAYLTDDNLINVEAGGTVTFQNQHGDDVRLPVPSTITYDIDLQEALNG